jgi:uncharacterized protein (TIGR00255 family)
MMPDKPVPSTDSATPAEAAPKAEQPRAGAQKRKRKEPASLAAPPPIRSMTGYGRVEGGKDRKLTAEIRAVNGRFLKLGIKLPGRYGALEERIKALLAEEGLKRGNVDIAIFFDGLAEDGAYSIDENAVKRYAAQARTLAQKYKLKGKINLGVLLALPGALKRQDEAEDLDEIWARVKEALRRAIAQCNQMREREGAAMLAELRQQLSLLAAHQAAIQSAAPRVQQASIQKWKTRLAKLLEQQQVSVPLNSDVMEREVVQMADRMDISEELARLRSHFKQMEETFEAGGEVGKRLDFLTQELLRETNTIGSKAQDEQITHRVVEMKGLIEKIREQVQNLE